MFLGVIQKQPSEALPFDISYIPALRGRAGSISGTPVVDAPAGITLDSVNVVDATTLRIALSGGTTGQSYAFEVTTTLSIGATTEVVEDEFILQVLDLTPSLAQFWMSGSRELADGMDRLLPWVNGCPYETALHHLKQAAIQFFQKSQVWVQDLYPLATSLDTTLYAFPLPYQAALVKVLGYELDDEDNAIATPHDGRLIKTWGTSDPAMWTLDRATLEINPPPAAGQSLKVRAALKPTQDATYIPAAMYEHYIDAIVYGAAGRLMELPRQPWTDMDMADRVNAKFRDAISKAGIEAERGYGRSRLAVRGHFY